MPEVTQKVPRRTARSVASSLPPLRDFGLEQILIDWLIDELIKIASHCVTQAGLELMELSVTGMHYCAWLELILFLFIIVKVFL